MIREIWKPIIEFPLYQVSSLGNARSSAQSKIGKFKPLKTGVSSSGFRTISVGNKGDKKRTTLYINKLVGAYHVKAKKSLRNSNFLLNLDGNKLNDEKTNLIFGDPTHTSIAKRNKILKEAGVKVLPSDKAKGDKAEANNANKKANKANAIANKTGGAANKVIQKVAVKAPKKVTKKISTRTSKQAAIIRLNKSVKNMPQIELLDFPNRKKSDLETPVKGVRRTLAKVVEGEVRIMRRLSKEDVSNAKLGRAFLLSEVAVGRIINRKVWSDLDE